MFTVGTNLSASVKGKEKTVEVQGTLVHIFPAYTEPDIADVEKYYGYDYPGFVLQPIRVDRLVIEKDPDIYVVIPAVPQNTIVEIA